MRKIIFASLTAVLVVFIYGWWFGPSTLRYKLSYSVLIDNRFALAEGVFEARATDTGFSLSGEAIPLRISKNEFLVFTLDGGKPISAHHSNDKKESFDHFKLLWLAFSGRHGTDPLSISGLLSNLQEEKPSACIPSKILPKMYIIENEDFQLPLREIARNELIDAGIKVEKICISISKEPITRGRINTHFPWIIELSHEDIRNRLLQFEFYKSHIL